GLRRARHRRLRAGASRPARPRRVMADFDQVSLVDVSRHFGRRRAVSQVTLSARRGEIVGLLGPNGAGKSTLIGMAASLVSPTSGEVRYGERTARILGPSLRLQIGLLAH